MPTILNMFEIPSMPDISYILLLPNTAVNLLNNDPTTQSSQSQLSSSSLAKLPNPSSSTSSNPSTSVQSTSIIATTCPHQYNPIFHTRTKLTSPLFPTIGTTISLLLSPSHAICPGYSRTSSTLTILFWAAAAPHTPRPMAMLWHAGRPWKGPRMRVEGWERFRV